MLRWRTCAGGENVAASKWPEVAERLELVEGWARNGCTDAEIAANLGIALSTFYAYKVEHSEFSEALKRNKELADLQVEGALFRRALGYRYDEETFATVTDGETGEERQVLVKRVTKEAPPDVTAQIFWLKNRKPQEWRERREDGGGLEQETGVALLPPVLQEEGGGDG